MAIAIRARRLAGDAAEQRREVRRRGAADPARDRVDLEVGVDEQRARQLDARRFELGAEGRSRLLQVALQRAIGATEPSRRRRQRHVVGRVAQQIAEVRRHERDAGGALGQRADLVAGPGPVGPLEPVEAAARLGKMRH